MADVFDPVPIPMLTDASVDETTSEPVALNNTSQHWHEVRAGVGVASGVVTIETAGDRNEAGAWEELTTITVTGPGSYGSSISFPGPGGFVRHRISTVIGGGTITSTMRRKLHY